MKAKCTIPAVAPVARAKARQAIRPLQPGFAERWRGKFKPAERATGRYRKLASKYM